MTHTFEELEALCKKRLLKKYSIIGGAIFGGLVTVSLIAYGTYKFFASDNEETNKKIVKHENVKHKQFETEIKAEEITESHIEHNNKPEPKLEVREERVIEKPKKEHIEMPKLEEFEKEMPPTNKIRENRREEVEHIERHEKVIHKPKPHIEEPLAEPEMIEEEPARVLTPILDFNIYSENYAPKPKKHTYNKPVHHKPAPKPKEHLVEENKIVHNQPKKFQGIETAPAPKEEPVIESVEIPPFDVCIAMSKKYYKQGKYKEALEWAKKANIQNKEAPDSWIMTAKILNKLGEKDRAIRILKVYYDFNPDNQVKALLEKIEKGE